MKQALLILLLLTPLASAATITGTIYDYGLRPVPGAVVQIDTTPAQTVVAQEGTYTLSVPAGTYTIKVSKATGERLEEKTEATITVPETGTFTYDLILFQELQEFEEPKLDILMEEEPITTISPLILLAILLIVISAGIFAVTRMKRNIEREIEEEDDLAEQLLQFIRKEKRTTQKDIRKAFPYAEATISLALTSLEHEKKITKVKRGRSNIILYNKVKRT